MAETGVEAVLLDLVLLFGVAGTVAAVAARFAHVPYTVALLLVGIAASLVGVEFRTALSDPLVSDLVLVVIVPALLFQGASRVDVEQFREELGSILAFAVVGLLASVVLLGIAGTVVFGFPGVVALLFAAIVLPTDPAAVLAIFEDVGAPERLAVLVDGESMLNDGVGVVLYTAFLGLALDALARGEAVRTFVSPGELAREVALDIVVATAGGLVVGLVSGYVVYRVVAALDDPMTTVLLSVVLAYGAFLLGEALELSGFVAVVGAGLLVAERRSDPGFGGHARLTFRTTWASAAFLANTVLFLLIGFRTPFDLLARYAAPAAVAVILVFLARAVVVYPLAAVLDRTPVEPIPRSSQHVLVWSGIHVSVPLALVLGLPEAFPAALAGQLQAMVFGVAAVTLVVQGLTMKRLLVRLGLAADATGAD